MRNDRQNSYQSRQSQSGSQEIQGIQESARTYQTGYQTRNQSTQNYTADPKTDLQDLDSGIEANGILEVMPDGFGFIRCENFLPGDNDVYVAPSQIRRFNMKTGDIICGSRRVKSATEKFAALLYVKTINGYPTSVVERRPNFEDLTPVLSGGELTRLRLAKLLLEKPDVLILDEPTNHLDFATMEWLENYLKGYSGAVLVVSHDRYFLDNVCTKIWEVSFQTMTTYKGNFSAYLPQKEAADALRQKQHDADVALAEKLQDYIDRNLVRASTTKMAQSRRKQLEKLEITEAPQDETNQLKFRFEYDVEPWNELVLLKNLTIQIGGRTLLEPFTYTVCRGQRLIIAGPNGAGKSTLMQVLDGKRRPSGGMVRLGTGARPSIFAQQQNRIGAGRVIDVIWNKYPRMTELEVRSHLAKLGFRGETVFKPCEALSGGELARLRFAEIVLERPNLLFLDEPTNHLDIYTRENLTEALMAYTGTLLLVTHDRHLMNSLACPILYLEDGKAVIYPSYDALMGRAAPAPVAEKSSEPAKAGYGKEQRRRRAELRAKIKACEDEMEACGAREVELENEINSPEVYNDPQLLREKSDELSDLRFHQDELFAAWEAAVEEQEQYEQTAGGEE